jgi:hypothetical protein
LRELNQGGPPKDGIPAIDKPEFDDTGQAGRWLNPKEPVLVVELADQARAYPLQILIWHELANDQIEDLPLLLSYCPLCNSAIAFDRRVDGKVYTFGVSGMVRNSDMVMYDRQTESLWQQIGGEAIVGGLTGKRLAVVPSQIVSFSEFARTFPQGRVLNRETGYSRAYGQNPYAGYETANRPIMPVKIDRPLRLPPLERIVTVELEGRSRAYPFSLLRRRHVLEDRIKDKRFVILFQPGTLTPLDRPRISESQDVGSAAVFYPEVDGKRLSFAEKNGKVADKQTASTWNLFGISTDGPLAGKRLDAVPHGIYFAFAWLVFNPSTEVVGQPPAFEAEPLEGGRR